jgi:hypothetical protein
LRAVIGRLGRIFLGLFLLVQAGPTCACALEHALLCGGSNDTVAAVSTGLTGPGRCCDDPGCTAPTSCTGHSHHEAACSARGLSEPPKQQASNGNPAIVDFCWLSIFCPARSSPDRVSSDDPPDLRVGSARSLPLLI